MNETGNQKYAGFWIRVAASIIDTILLVAVIVPILMVVYGPEVMHPGRAPGLVDILMQWVFPPLAVIIFWVTKSATPGKMLFKIRIVDAKTGGKPSTGQCIGRYLAYYVSIIPFMLGIIWVAFDKRKQGWHDKLANTLVIRD
jgi:uncharacterized RDD family membrane protein YckC